MFQLGLLNPRHTSRNIINMAMKGDWLPLITKTCVRGSHTRMIHAVFFNNLI